jgi:hypothetical protein
VNTFKSVEMAFFEVILRGSQWVVAEQTVIERENLNILEYLHENASFSVPSPCSSVVYFWLLRQAFTIIKQSIVKN